MKTQIRLLLLEQSDLGPHCLPVSKNRFGKFARIFSRRHKQTTFSDVGFLGVLRVKNNRKIISKEILPLPLILEKRLSNTKESMRTSTS